MTLLIITDESNPAVATITKKISDTLEKRKIPYNVIDSINLSMRSKMQYESMMCANNIDSLPIIYDNQENKMVNIRNFTR